MNFVTYLLNLKYKIVDTFYTVLLVKIIIENIVYYIYMIFWQLINFDTAFNVPLINHINRKEIKQT